MLELKLRNKSHICSTSVHSWQARAATDWSGVNAYVEYYTTGKISCFQVKTSSWLLEFLQKLSSFLVFLSCLWDLTEVCERSRLTNLQQVIYFWIWISNMIFKSIVGKKCFWRFFFFPSFFSLFSFQFGLIAEIDLMQLGNTVMLDENDTLTKEVLLKWGWFERR